ncbi:hypothetical protein BX600DRAFT_446241 [Xylariales sp. PMI_506]|nr:hypothetical protein BX600DRAFT_446241 [Xylariales sp. PMI_506]
MPKSGKRLHLLRRPKIRQSWNKVNLYNIVRQREPKIGTFDQETFFQQKWRAKGLLRAYHGEHIKESDWERMFSRRLLSVVNMEPKYMAKFDGSEKAAGRGSGKEEPPQRGAESILPKATTPYMNMTFAPMERRLDIAVFRAMFASSARQARQFCVHGAVKVNGKVMPYPAYKLNPGDMFQVDPEMVMFATGAPKKQRSDDTAPKSDQEESTDAAETEIAPVEEAEGATEEAGAAAEQDPDTTDTPVLEPADMKPTRKVVQDLVEQAKAAIQGNDFTVAKKRQIRSFIKGAKPLLSKAGRASATPKDIITELNKMISDLNLAEPDASTEAVAKDEAPQSLAELTSKQMAQLERRISEELDNPFDPTKPYATPWRPRPYMAPFAFIPRYLEVNPKICSAVYLRHPVARVGSAEVPTPFPYYISQLAFNWYLRRR